MLPQKRLHISPWSSEHLNTILRPVQIQVASDISFHTVDTFPENNYGYVTLPTDEADKLKKKLHGCVLRGRKMKVEEARPKRATEVTPAGEDENDKSSIRKTSRRVKVDAKRNGTLTGIELPDERKVKRGWTESGTTSKTRSKKEKAGTSTEKKPKRKAESITGKEECLFKTKLPPNTRSIEAEKSEQKKKRKRADPPNGETVIHEFKNNSKHATFLREKSGIASAKTAVEYVDGKGWIDEDGVVVEQAPSKAAPRNRHRPSARKAQPETTAAVTAPSDSETSSSGTSSSESDESEDQDDALPTVLETVEKPNTRTKPPALELNSSNDAVTQPDGLERLSIVRSSATPPRTTSDVPESAEPHPLETLFKRPAKAASHSHTPRKPNLEVSTSFSFFDPDGNEQEAVPLTAVPQTPFTQRDLRERRQRSAAPTPDTAAPGKTFSSVFGGGQSSPIPSGDEDEEEEEEHEVAGPPRNGPETEEKRTQWDNVEGEESQFAKWFWEHRGENNRAWKRRRREAAKESRQRENRQRKG